MEHVSRRLHSGAAAVEIGPRASRFRGPLAAVRAHWTLYVAEATELGAFMVSACLCTVLLFHPASPAAALPALLRRITMGVSMAATAIAIIKSPMGRHSGAHFNPAISLTFFRLGKIGPWDLVFYIAAQFTGAIGGVGFAAMLAGTRLAAPQVAFAVTVPGPAGAGAAFAAELGMAALLMAVVLVSSNRPRLAPWTTWLVGGLIASYIVLFAPVSGFSINPARTTGSAVFAHVWTSIWIYFTAPPLGMLAAAEVYLRASSAPRPHYFRHRHLTHPPPAL